MKQTISLFTLMVFMACSGHKKEPVSATLQEAQQLHKESITTYNKLSDSVDSLLNVYPDETSLGNLEQALQEWHENLVEVPGMPHDHEGHDHDHEPPPQLTDEQHLAVQQQINANIKKIENQYQNLNMP